MDHETASKNESRNQATKSPLRIGGFAILISMEKMIDTLPTDTAPTIEHAPKKSASITEQIRFHKEKIAEVTEAQKRLEVMKSYDVAEHELADQSLVATAHLPIDEHYQALEQLSVERAKQKAQKMGALKSILHFFKLG